MATETFEFARIASAEEVADYLSSLARSLQGGEVRLESGDHALRLVPAPELKVDVRVRQRESKGSLRLKLGWKRRTTSKAVELQIQVGPLPVS